MALFTRSSKQEPRRSGGLLGEITGLSPLARGAVTPMKSFFRLVKAGQSTLPHAHVTEPASSEYNVLTPRERFALEADREKLSSQEIIFLARRSRYRGWISGSVAIVMLLYAVFYTMQVLAHGVHALGFMNLSYVWVFFLAIASYSLKENLRAYQFRNRSLVSFGEWLGTRTPRGKGSMQATADQKKLIGWMVVLGGGTIACLYPHASYAAGSGTSQGVFSSGQATSPMQSAIGILSRLQPTDLSAQWLSRLFPSLTGGPSSTLASMFAAFNTIVLDIGGVFVFWQMALTMVYAAQNGSLRGSRVHIPYSAIRTFVGGASLAPVLGGFCIAQALALQILGAGYWAADQLYDAMVGATLNSSAIAQSIGQMPIQGVGTLLSRTLSVETCYAWSVANDQDLTAVGVTHPTSPMYAARFAVNTGSSSVPWDNIGSPTGNNYSVDAGECGALLVPEVTQGGANDVYSPTASQTFDTKRIADFQKYMDALWSSGLPTSLASLITANGGAKVGMPAPSTPTANNLTSDYQKAQTAAVSYLGSTRALAQSLAESDLSQSAGSGSAGGAPASSSGMSYASAISATAKAQGWVSAGALYSRVSEMFTHSIGAMQSSVPSLTMPQISGMPVSDANHVEAAYLTADQMMGSNLLPLSNSGSTTNTVLPSSGSDFNAAAAEQRVLGEPTASLMMSLNRMLLINPADPIGSIAADGSTMIYTGAGILGAIGLAKLVSFGAFGVAAKVASVAAGGKLAGIIGQAAGFFVSMGVVLGEVLIGLGSFETYVVPMMFYIIWMFAIVNAIAFAAEFVLSAPIAALQHMRLFGEEAINQEQRQFYIISFIQGFLRPSLLLFGLAISTFVLSAVAQVFDATFNLAAAASLGGATVGPIGIFVFALMLIFIQFQLAIRSAELITRVPDAVADLVGGYLSRMGGERPGDIGERLYGSGHRRISTGLQVAQKSLSPGSASTGAGGGGVSGNLG